MKSLSEIIWYNSGDTDVYILTNDDRQYVLHSRILPVLLQKTVVLEIPHGCVCVPPVVGDPVCHMARIT